MGNETGDANGSEDGVSQEPTRRPARVWLPLCTSSIRMYYLYRRVGERWSVRSYRAVEHRPPFQAPWIEEPRWIGDAPPVALEARSPILVWYKIWAMKPMVLFLAKAVHAVKQQSAYEAPMNRTGSYTSPVRTSVFRSSHLFCSHFFFLLLSPRDVSQIRGH